jgi:hypothetical protein
MEPFSWDLYDNPSSSPSLQNGEKGNAADTAATTPQKSHIALRRFRPPAAASIFTSKDRHLQSDKIAGKVIGQSGPFLFSGNWWDEKSWARAEWDMQLDDNSLIRCHEAEGVWKVDGIYD